MSRADRILDVLELLRAREATTVDAIAEALGVSRRTVLRDLSLLRARGWPIVGEPGPGGGVRLERERGVAAVHLGSDEVISLWLCAKLSVSVGSLPWSAAARSALDKVLASVPDGRRRALRRLLSRVVIGRPATPRIRAELGAPAPELLPAIERAFTGGCCLAFSYIDRHGRASRRRVEPHGLLLEAPAWYLLARDVESDGARMFRMDRIRRARVLTERTFQPDLEGLHAKARAQRGESPARGR
ncbi:MAG: WYL domain-containing protein [Nannocystaceae bacterium]